MFRIIILCLIILLGCSKIKNEEATKDVKKSIDGSNIVQSRDEIILNKITIEMSSQLIRMTKKMLEEKYTAKVRPLVAFSNKDASATFSFNSIPQQVDEDKLAELLPVMGQQFEKVYPKISWISKGMTQVENKQFIEYEFTSPTANKEVYSLVYITEIDGFLLISTFSSTTEQQSKWQPLARESMKSIQLI